MDRANLTSPHRGGFAGRVKTIWPAQDLFQRLGGRTVLGRVVDGLYNRIAEDPVLQPIFRGRALSEHSRQKYFFEEWMGGEPLYTTEVGGHGSRLFHERFPITRRSAGRWLRHMVSSLREQGVEESLVREVVGCLAPMAHAMGRHGAPLPTSFLESDLEGRRGILGRQPDLLAQHPEEGRRLLFEACSHGDDQAVELYLGHGVSVDAPSLVDDLMLTPWCRAMAGGFSEVACLLERHGAIKDVFSAAYLGDLELLSSWLARSPKWVDAEDPAMDHRRISPLHHSFGGGRPEAAVWLLERGAEPGADGHRLLRQAANAGWSVVVAALLDKGVSAELMGPGPWVLHPGIADRLLAAGARPDRPEDAWLHYCGSGSPCGDAPLLVDALLEQGADLRAFAGTRSALHLAAAAGFVGVMGTLLNRGLEVDVEDANGETALAHISWAAAGVDRLETTRLLLEWGADPRHKGHRGISPLDRVRRLKSRDGRRRRELMEEACARR